MSRDAMIEAAALAMYDFDGRALPITVVRPPFGANVVSDEYRACAAAVLDVVRPLILREAAEILRADDDDSEFDGAGEWAARFLERLADGDMGRLRAA